MPSVDRIDQGGPDAELRPWAILRNEESYRTALTQVASIVSVIGLSATTVVITFAASVEAFPEILRPRSYRVTRISDDQEFTVTNVSANAGFTQITLTISPVLTTSAFRVVIEYMYADS